MTKKEQQQNDLKRTVIHEYGHLIVVRHYECGGYVDVFKNYNFDFEEITYQTRVLGRCYFTSGINELTDQEKLHVGLAGECASFVEGYEDDFSDNNYEDIADLILADSLAFSDSDIDMMGGQLPDDLDECIQVIRILAEHWDELKRESQMFIEDGLLISS